MKHCTFCSDRTCSLYLDYVLACREIEEAEELCRDNWREILTLYRYIDVLKNTLKENRIPIPVEY